MKTLKEQLIEMGGGDADIVYIRRKGVSTSTNDALGYKVLDIDDENTYPVYGVPISYLDKHNPEMFVIIGMLDKPVVNGKALYKRIAIRPTRKYMLHILSKHFDGIVGR